MNQQACLDDIEEIVSRLAVGNMALADKLELEEELKSLKAMLAGMQAELQGLLQIEDSTARAVLDRMKARLGAQKDKELADELSVSQQAVYNARNINKVPDSWIKTIAQKSRTSMDWLCFGKGSADIVTPSTEGEKSWITTLDPKFISSLPPEHVTRIAYEKLQTQAVNSVQLPPDITFVPMVHAKLSAGHGSFETDSTSDKKYAFRADFLRRKGNPREMVLMRVSGDSMAPAIEDGDVVLIDESQNNPVPGKIYAVGVEDMVYLKKVDAQPGKLVLSSINSDYATMFIDTREQLEGQARIIGRAIWWCREA